MTKRTHSQQIGSEAENIFRILLPRCFEASKPEKDFGLDFIVQYFENEQNTPVFFAAQIKGSENLKYRPKCVSVSIPVLNLKDYVSIDMPFPIFLFGIDTNKRIGYWICIQEYALQNLIGRNKDKWRIKKNTTIRIPYENVLHYTSIEEEENKFIESVKGSFKFVRNFVQVESAIEAEKKLLKILEPRFDYQISFSDKVKEYNLFPANGEVPNFSLTSLSKEGTQKLITVFNTGKPVDFSSDEIKLSGSPIFDYFFKESCGVQVQFKREYKIQIWIAAIDKSGVEKVHLDVFDATLTAGQNQFSIKGKLGHSPIAIDDTLALRPDIQRGTLKKFLALNRWKGQRLNFISHFDQIYSLYKSLDDNTKLHIFISFEGNRVELANLKYESEDINMINEVLDIYRKARMVAKYFNINPIAPIPFKNKDVREINYMYDLVIMGKVILPVPKFNLKLILPKNNIKKLFEKPDVKINESSTISFKSINEVTRYFLGNKINVGRICRKIDKVVLSNRDFIEEQLLESSEDSIQIEFSGIDDSQMTESQIKD